jgi:hypothetical protein
VAWVFLCYGTDAVSIALVGLFWGARKGYRTTEDGGDSDLVVIELLQFGDGARHEIVLKSAHWLNSTKNLTASPARVERPHSHDDGNT